jgi:hypothetical protein
MKKITFLIAAMSMGLLTCISFAQNVANFEDLSIETNSFWNGDDESGQFISGGWIFYNTYNSGFDSWNGWAYSNMTDIETYSWENQYSAASVPSSPVENNYAVSYIIADWENDYSPIPAVIKTDNEEAVSVAGTWICLNAYASLYMEDEGAYGGNYANSHHYLKLIVRGYSPIAFTWSTLEVYLADYRFQNNDYNYKFDTWKYINLESLGEVSELEFILESSDSGDYGLNTPAYFCIDNFNQNYTLSVLPELYSEAPENFSINAGETVDISILAAGGIQPFSYSWESNESLSATSGETVNASPLETTTYTVTVSDQSSQENVHNITVNVNNVNVLSNYENNINIYPVPAKDFLTIYGVDNADFKTLIISDLQGREIKNIAVESEKFDIDVNELPQGVYLLIFQGETNTYKRKISKI